MDLVDNLSSSLWKENSEIARENIRNIGEAINTVKSLHPDLRTPCIAGGAVRDMVFGLTPSDYDIFFDTSFLPADEREDFVLLFGASVTEELAKLPCYETLKDNVLRCIGDGSKYGDAAMPSDWKEFFVYETSPSLNDGVDMRWLEIRERDGEVAANKAFRYVKLQFIGRTEEALAADDVTPFLDTFDWPLTKALFDPKDMEFKFSDAFLDQMQRKEIECTDHRSYERAYRWTERFKYSFERGAPKACPFKVVDKTPKKPKISSYDSIFSTGTGILFNTSSMATNATWANF